jgi:hypothetical protein
MSTGRTTTARSNFITGLESPAHVAVDAAHIYWGSSSTGTIGRANLDGTGVEPAFITAATYAYAVAADDLPLPPPPPVPEISNLLISPRSFLAAPHGPSIAPRPPVGATVSYQDSQPALTTFTVQRPRRGIRSHGKCVKPRRGLRGRRCTRYVRVGRFSHQDSQGTDSFRFTGRLKGHRLRPGRYRLRAVPVLNGQRGAAATARFRILR